MSGIEAIGVLASIGQLLEFGLKITSLINDVYNRVKDAPEKVLLHTAHIKQLVETACLIQEESELQNPIVHSHVRATLEEAEKLQRILERMVVDYTKGSGKKRLWKTLVGREERRMIASFDRLEKEKSALILCISFTHTETLGIIRDSVGELIPRINSMDQGVNAINRRFRRASRHQSHGMKNTVQREERRFGVFTDAEEGNRSLVVRETSHDIAAKKGTRKDVVPPVESRTTGVIINPVSRGDATFVCGDFQTGVTRNLLVKDSESKDDSLMVGGHWGGSGNHKSVAPRASGRSITILGNVGTSSTVDDIYDTLQQSNRRF